MTRLRTFLFWCHLACGVTAGVVILIMSVTGVLLTYEKQIMLWADTRGYDAAPPSADAARLPIDALLARVRAARPDAAIQAIAVRSDRSAPVALTLGREGTLYVHPYTGAILGGGAQGVRDFFRGVTNWHRWLAVGAANRTTGRAITGASNLIFLFIVCSGLYLWFPRIWTRRQFAQVLWFRRGLPGRARDFNWHNVIGFWSAIPLAIVVASATVISYPWASNLVYRAAGEEPPAPGRAAGGAARAEGARAEGGRAREGGRQARTDGGPARETTPREAASREVASREVVVDSVDVAWARAEQQVDGWRLITLRLPASAEAPLAFTIDRGSSGQPQKRATLTLDRRTGAVVRWEPFSSTSRGRQWRSLLRFAHTGEVLGLAGQTVAGLVSAGGAVLVYTGLFLSVRRFLAWRRRRAGSPATGAVTADRPIGAAAARRAEAVD
jgi:uncharacterized iron-regulated membrane protein